jgi:hypothetical protein
MQVGVEDSKPGSADAGSSAQLVRALLLGSGLVLGLLALVYNEWTLGRASSSELPALIRERIRGSQALFALGGALLLLASEGVRRALPLRALAARRTTPVVLLAALGLLLPILILELGLRPFVEPKTTLYVTDPELLWRLRPGADAEWGHVRIRINAKGLRGPELAWEKPDGVFRVLYLGDSVTFGYGLERVEDSYPYLVGAELKRRLGRPVETVNSGVGGWSPWQQYGYLRREGFRYQPDLLVVGFVLNDVTETLALIPFGGQDYGWDLARTARSWLDGWLSRSALVSFAREGFAVFRFGSQVFLGAQRYEAEEIRWFATHPRDESLRRAWAIAFESLGKIFSAASERRIPAALLLFPFAFQLSLPGGAAGPQDMVRSFAEARGVPVLDLLPILAAEARAGGELASPGGGLFLDPSHLSVRGSQVAAAAIVEFLGERGLAPPPGTGAGAERRPASPAAPAAATTR